mmetsp:Transcript_74679/g.175268  ORF Transcript_74679/g.175268 Transcript_74679/m.175268 type:complete len:209 (+) Transcript_74679:46-672(+)
MDPVYVAHDPSRDLYRVREMLWKRLNRQPRYNLYFSLPGFPQPSFLHLFPRAYPLRGTSPTSDSQHYVAIFDALEVAMQLFLSFEQDLGLGKSRGVRGLRKLPSGDVASFVGNLEFHHQRTPISDTLKVHFTTALVNVLGRVRLAPELKLLSGGPWSSGERAFQSFQLWSAVHTHMDHLQLDEEQRQHLVKEQPELRVAATTVLSAPP